MVYFVWRTEDRVSLFIVPLNLSRTLSHFKVEVRAWNNERSSTIGRLWIRVILSDRSRYLSLTIYIISCVEESTNVLFYSTTDLPWMLSGTTLFTLKNDDNNGGGSSVSDSGSLYYTGEYLLYCTWSVTEWIK